jgi:nucleotide-binding universal stress UspA family protein
MYKRILVPLDGSETAEVALPYARLGTYPDKRSYS